MYQILPALHDEKYTSKQLTSVQEMVDVGPGEVLACVTLAFRQKWTEVVDKPGEKNSLELYMYFKVEN